MCGIGGVWHTDGAPVDPADLRRLSAALAHRGPDDAGELLDGPVGLIHRRLAILDLSPAGRQPLGNEDGSVQLVYNGQIYGFEGVRERLLARGHRFRSRTDTEVLVHLYEERGDAFLEDVDGMFALALWDVRRRRLLLARDRVGQKPLAFVRCGPRLAFASEVQALLALPWVPRVVDPAGVVQYLYQSSLPGGSSVLAGITKLGPGELLVLEGPAETRRAWWRLPEAMPRAEGRLLDVLGNAVRSHLVADVPVGAFLSGGLDSTAVTLLAAEERPGLPTFSVRFVEDRALDEGDAAREVARSLGTTHHELALGPEAARALPEVLARADEPFAVASAIPLHHLARFARQTVKVVLTGDGADELLGGYPWRHEPDGGPAASLRARARGAALSAVRAWRSRRAGWPLARNVRGRLRRAGSTDERYAEIASAFTPEELEDLLHPDLRTLAAAGWDAHPVRAAYRAAPPGDEVNRRLRADFATTLVDEMLVKADRMTMACGLEARVPFLDRRVVEWAFAQPGRHKVRGGVGKRPLREALAPRLPRVAGRPKHGFDAPLGRWLRGPLRAELTDALAPEAVRRRGLLDAAAVQRLLHAHLRGSVDVSRRLYSLFVLELWLRRLEERPGPSPAS